MEMIRHTKEETIHREIKLDMLKGILIICVVAGHSGSELIHEIVFLFHMPLFFMISGYLYKDIKREKRKSYFINKAKRMMIPYFIYLCIDLFVFRKSYSASTIRAALWGGRSLAGVYWYMTCFFATLLLFTLIKHLFSDKIGKMVILLCGIAAIIESHLISHISILNAPGIPLNLDVCLMAIVYVAIGFYNKDKIKYYLASAERKIDIAAIVIVIILAVFCYFNYCSEIIRYSFDMKYVCYKELLLAVLIPGGFGFVLLRTVYWVEKVKICHLVKDVLVLLGKSTIPIMFLHIPLNIWQSTLGYGGIIYTLIGVGVPMVLVLVLRRINTIKMWFGL